MTNIKLNISPISHKLRLFKFHFSVSWFWRRNLLEDHHGLILVVLHEKSKVWTGGMQGYPYLSTIFAVFDHFVKVFVWMCFIFMMEVKKILEMMVIQFYNSNDNSDKKGFGCCPFKNWSTRSWPNWGRIGCARPYRSIGRRFLNIITNVSYQVASCSVVKTFWKDNFVWLIFLRIVKSRNIISIRG